MFNNYYDSSFFEQVANKQKTCLFNKLTGFDS